MNFIGGRPGQDGEPRVGFMRSWLVGQLVAMASMIAGIAGFGAILLNWPF